MSSFGHSTKNPKRVLNQLAGVSSTFSRIGIGVRDADHELEVAGVVHISTEQSTAPGTPVAADGGVIYVKNDGDLYYLSQDKAEVSLTASAGGGEANEDSFKNIAVSGQDSVVAETATDTLTFAQAGGITLTTTAASDTVTISSADTNTQLTQEEVEDFAGPLVATGGTKTGITITYQDGTGDMDFVVSDLTVTSDSGSTAMTPGDTLTIAGGTNISTAMVGDTLTINQSGGGEANEYSFKTIVVSGESDVVADADDDTLTLVAGTGISIATTADQITFTNTVTDTNTFRTVTAGGNTLGAGETLAFTAGTGVSITESAGAVTITNSVTDTNTWRTVTAGGNTLSTSETLAFTAGTGISITESAGAVTITNSVTDTNTWRTVTAGGNTLSTSETLAFTAGTGVSITESAGAVTINSTVTDTDTTYDLLCPLGTTAIRLDPSTGSNDDVTITAGTGITVTRNTATEMTIASTVTDTDTNTTYDLLCPSGTTAIRLDPSTGSNDDITITAGTGITVTRNSDTEMTIGNSVTDTNTWRTVTAGGNTLSTSETLAFTAGTGISIAEDAGAVTITNSVTDTNTWRTVTAGGNTLSTSETLAFTAGTGITIAEDAGAVTITNSVTDTNTWRTVTAGGNTLSTSETLAFTAGTGITIAEDAGAVTITNSVSGGGISHDGSTADGVLTYKDADEATVEANLTFDGSTLTVTGNVFVDGGADVNQVKIQGHSTQTSSPFLIEQSGGTDVFEVTSSGKVIGAAGAEFKGNSFVMGDTGGSTNFLHATGANNLNFRNHNANKDLQFDFPASSGELKFRTHDGSSAVTQTTLDSNGVWTHNVAMVATGDAVFKGDTDADLLVVDAGGEKVGVGVAAGSMRHKFDCRGSRGYATSQKSDDYTLTVDDAIIYADASGLGMGEELTVTLPTIFKGRIYEVYRRDDGSSGASVAVTAPSGTNLNGSDGGSVTLSTQYEGVRVVGISGTDDWIAHEMHAVGGVTP